MEAFGGEQIFMKTSTAQRCKYMAELCGIIRSAIQSVGCFLRVQMRGCAEVFASANAWVNGGFWRVQMRG